MRIAHELWYSISRDDAPRLRCAVCQNEIDLQYPTGDHHPRVCPACSTESVFLNWRGRTIQIAMDRAPGPLVQAIRWAQEHLDELEYVELVCALEDIGSSTRQHETESPGCE